MCFDKYSNISRLALSFDLTFLVLLLSSLYEPEEKSENCNCIFHPGKKYTTAQNEFSDYCADATVALAAPIIKFMATVTTFRFSTFSRNVPFVHSLNAPIAGPHQIW